MQVQISTVEINKDNGRNSIAVSIANRSLMSYINIGLDIEIKVEK